MTKKLHDVRIWVMSLLFLTASVSSFGQYCTPEISGCTWEATLDDFVTTGGFTNISNLNTGCGGGYSDFTDMSASGYRETMVNYSITLTTMGDGGIKMWIDWDQDEEFSDEEVVYVSPDIITAGSTVTGFFEIPATAAAGETRIRVRTNSWSDVSSACDAGWGEVEDYTFEVLVPEPCDGTFTGITLEAPDSICGSVPFLISATGVPVASGLTKVWQSRVPSGTGPWTTITGATSSILEVASGISAATDFRLIVTCVATGDSDTSTIVTVEKNPGSACYCTPSTSGGFSGCSGVRIDNFSTTGGVDNISNLNTNCSGSSGYGNFTDSIASQYQGAVVNYNIKVESTWGTTTVTAKMWIDWDQDGTFTDSEIIYNGEDVSSGTDLTGSFEVPGDALAGTTRLRVKMQTSPFDDPCVFSPWTTGEVEDYSFEVLVPDPCSEATFTEITLNGPDSICAGENPFTITSTGTPIASGLTKVWESAPAGSGDWTVIDGASFSFLEVSGITEATDYRYTVTCVETGEEAVSEIWTVDLNPPTECYCIPLYTMGGGCSWGNDIDDVSTTGGTANISNLGTGCASGAAGYSDYRDQFVTAFQGTIVNYNINLSSEWMAARMWIDWNQDGDFSDEGELMYQSSTIPGMYAPMEISGSFEVPYDAPAGSTGMRIRTFNTWTLEDYMDACYDYTWGSGETEDYTFNVEIPPPCDDVPFTGLSIEGPESVCAAIAFAVTSEGTPVASGLQRIWQKKTAGGDWTTITGATMLTLNVTDGITEATDFRYIVVCTLNDEADTSNVISVGINPPTECYCEAEFYGAYDMDMGWAEHKIKDFIIRGQTDTLYSLNTPFPFDGTSSGDLGGYTNYTVDTPSLKIPDLIQTGTYTGQVKTRLTWEGVTDRVWIDYNDDGFFEDSEEIHAFNTDPGEGFSSSTSDNFSFTIPLDATPGIHRLRVRLIQTWSDPFPIDPCYTYQYGQTQDYLVEIQELKPCAEVIFPDSVGAVSNPPNVCSSGDITLNLTSTMPLAAGISYQWKASATEDGTYTNVGPELEGIDGPMLTLTGVSTDRYYRCYVLCEGEPILISDAVYVQAVDIEGVELTVTDGQSCGPGTVTLTASSTDGSVFWYTDAAGGSPIGMGDEYVTPPLSVTDTFYATGGAFGASDVIVGDGTGSSSTWTPGPFAPNNGSKVLQYMYTADQLHAAGLTTAGGIESIAFNLASLPSHALGDYRVSIKAVTTAPPMTWQTSGWEEVYTAATLDPEATGWITFPFDAPFNWNGTDNIMIKVCYTTPDMEYTWEGSGGAHKYTNKPGQVMYYNNNSTTISACANTYGYTGYTELPNAKFYIPGCETERTAVIAYIRPVPAPINIGPDETICKDPDNGLTLDAGDQPDTYTFLWDNGGTEQTRRITESGTYYVEVANEFGCAVYDTVTKTLLDIPEVDLGNDTTVCEGGVVTISAGSDGTTYYWSTGDTESSIDIIAAGEYSVLVANADGCIALDTINITVSGTMPSVASIVVTNMDLYTFSFEPLLPAHVVTYEWDFGDGSETSDLESPTHTYATSGSYTVKLTVRSECGEVVYFTSAHIVGVGNVNIDDQSVVLYPNPAHEVAIIESKGDLTMKAITVTNILGQVIHQSDLAQADKYRLDLSGYASGIYTVRIDTDKGAVVRKFEILK